MTYDFGVGGAGTVFRLTVVPDPPLLTTISSGVNAILSWPTNASEYSLQSTPKFASPFWTTNSRDFVIIDGQNVLTNRIPGTQQS